MQALPRFLCALVLLATLSLTVTTVPARAQTAPRPWLLLAQLNGHWRCVASDGKKTERSYLAGAVQHGVRPQYGSVEGREDAIGPNDDPLGVTERLVLQRDGNVDAQTFEGTSTGTLDDDGSLLLRSSADDAEAFTVRYVVAGDTLRRSVTRGTQARDERCEREAPAPTTTHCATPNVNGYTVRPGAVPYAAEAATQHVFGNVFVVVTLDDRSQVLWATIQSSPSPLLDDAALSAAENSTYQVQVKDCRPFAGDYIFTVTFRPR